MFKSSFKKFSSRHVFFSAVLSVLLMTATQTASALQDPTRPDVYRGAKKTPKTVYKLTSVLLGENRKVATINGVSYLEGERTSLGKLITINSDHVVIKGTKRHVLKLHNAPVRNSH